MKKQLGYLTLLFAVFWMFTAFSLAQFQQSSFTAYYPSKFKIRFENSTVLVTGLSFNYDVSTQTFTHANVTLYSTQTANVTVNIQLYSSSLPIASGNSSLYNLPENTPSTLTFIELTWIENYKAENVTEGEIIIQQQPEEAT